MKKPESILGTIFVSHIVVACCWIPIIIVREIVKEILAHYAK